MATPSAGMVLDKYTQNPDTRVIEATYEIYAPTFEKSLPVSPESLQLALDQLAATNPQAANVDLDRLVDSRFVDEISRAGVVERLYGN